MQDMAETERYLRATTGPLVILLSAILDPDGIADREALADIAAGHALVGRLRAAAFDESVRRPFLPRSVLADHGAETRSFAELKADAGARKAIKALAGHAQGQIQKGLRVRKRAGLAPLLLPARQARTRIRQLAALDHDPFRPEFSALDPMDVWRFWLARLTRRY